jgi:uncharacterized protein (TIGR00369 family)
MTKGGPSPEWPDAVALGESLGPLSFVPRAAAPGSASWAYTVDPAHYKPHGVLHGGVVMALLDSAMGHAVAALIAPENAFNAAAQMNVNFLEPIRAGTIVAHAKVRKRGKRLAIVEAEAVDDDGRVVAIATATHSIIAGK